MQLRDYQLEIKNSIESTFKGFRCIMCQMPTGTGKTVVLSSIIKEYLFKNDNNSVLVVAHRKEILEQIYETLQNYQLGEYLSKGRIIVESIQKLNNVLKNDTNTPFKPSLIIIDEAHHAQASTYKALWQQWQDAKFLGMTATPCRLKKEGFTDLFDKLLCAWNVKRFIMEGWLADYKYVAIKPDSEMHQRIEQLSKRGADGDYQVKEMESVMDNRACIEQLYRSYKEYATGRQGIIYAINREHAEHIRAFYAEKGESIMLIDSHTPKAERSQLMQEYRDGQIRIFVNCEIAGEGVDIPNVSFIQMARPTLSLSKYLQQVGRGLRPNPNKEKTIILDNVGMYYMFGLPNEDRDWEKMFRGGQTLPSLNIQKNNNINRDKINDDDYDDGHNYDMVIIKNEQNESNKVVIDQINRAGNKEYVLRKNGKIIADNMFVCVYRYEDVIALGSAYDGHYFLYDDNGIFLYEAENKFVILPGLFIKSHNQWGIEIYLDLLSGLEYNILPHVWNCGNASFIEEVDGWHLRQKDYSWIVVDREDVKLYDRVTCFKDKINGASYLFTNGRTVLRILGTEEDGSLVLSNDTRTGYLMSLKNGSFSVYSNNEQNQWIFKKWNKQFLSRPTPRTKGNHRIPGDDNSLEIFKYKGLYGWKKGNKVLCSAKFKKTILFSDEKFVLVTLNENPEKNIVVDINGNVVYDKHHVDKLNGDIATYVEKHRGRVYQNTVYLPEGYVKRIHADKMDIEGFNFVRAYIYGENDFCYVPILTWASDFYLDNIYMKHGVLHATHYNTKKEVVGFLDEPNKFYFLISEKKDVWELSEISLYNLVRKQKEYHTQENVK